MWTLQSGHCARGARKSNGGSRERFRRYHFASKRMTLAPNVLCGLYNQRELGHLLVIVEHVAFHCGREAALRGEAELLERDVLGGLVDASLEEVLGLQLAALGGDQAEDHHLVLGHEAQRGEAAGARVVVLEEE